jgi:hypothetical protein
VQPLWKAVWGFLKKLEIKLLSDSVIHSWASTQKNVRQDTVQITCTPMFIATLFIIAKLWKQPRCPTTDEWIVKLWYINTMEYYSPQGIMTWHLKVTGCNWRTSC